MFLGMFDFREISVYSRLYDIKSSLEKKTRLRLKSSGLFLSTKCNSLNHRQFLIFIVFFIAQISRCIIRQITLNEIEQDKAKGWLDQKYFNTMNRIIQNASC